MSGLSGRRKRKWDVPAEHVEKNENSNASEAARKARERAAELAAKLAAKGKLVQGVAPPPVIAPAAVKPPIGTTGPPTPSISIKSEIADPEIVKLEGGGYMVELEINDLPARVNLTKKNIQEKISQQSGAAISTKGRFVPPEEKDLLKGERPLYLNIQAPIQAKVQVAIHMIKDTVRNFGKPEQPVNSFNGTQNQNLNYVQDKVFVGLDFAPPDYNIKEKLEGQNGSYLQHIMTQTGAKVHLRGKGSGFVEPNSGRESFEALHIYISHPRPEGLQAAKSLCESLLQTVHSDFKNWDQTKRQRPVYPTQGYGQPAYQPPPTMYPGFNVPPPNYDQRGNIVPPNMAPSSAHSQAPPPGPYQPSNYAQPSQFPREPPPYHPAYQPPYSQSQPKECITGYPNVSQNAFSMPPGYQPGTIPPHIPIPPQPASFQPSYQESQKSDQESTAPKPERRRRRFTEDPELIRKASQSKETKESTSHSLDSNTKFRSSGEPTEDAPRYRSRDSHSQLSSDAPRVSRLSHSRDSALLKNEKSFIKPTTSSSVAAKKTKKKTSSKTVLSSLIAYDDSDSDSEE